MYRRLLLSLLLTFLSAVCVAQRRNVPADLTIRVHYADEQAAGAQLRVELLTASGMHVAEAQTDSRGQVDFEAAQGNYTLRISGVDIETTNTPQFTVGYGELSHIEFVQVPRRKAATDTPKPAGSSSPTVSAETLNLPKKVRDAYDKGNEKLTAQKWEDARKEFEQALKEAPGFAAAQHNLGVACAHLEDDTCARRAFEAALRLDPKMAPAYLNLGRIEFKAHNFPDAAALLKKYVAVSPQDPEGVVMLSEAELKSGDYAAALADARRVNAFPQHASFGICHYVAARALEAQQRMPEAAQEYEIFLRDNPASPQAAMARAALERLKK